MVLVAVIASLLLSLLLFVITATDVVGLLSHASDYFVAPIEDRKVLKIEMVAHTVGAIDGFLLATILLIFALGLYELFISDIDDAEGSEVGDKILAIHSLDELKSKLGNVIVMVLIVSFFKKVLHTNFETPLEMMYFALSITLLSVGLYFLSKVGKH